MTAPFSSDLIQGELWPVAQERLDKFVSCRKMYSHVKYAFQKK